MAYPSRFGNNDETYQEGFFSKWKERREEKKAKLAEDLQNLISAGNKFGIKKNDLHQESSVNVSNIVKVPTEGESKALSPDSVTTESSLDMKTQVSKVIGESEDLITALEAVGAMYGIPSENIMVDNSLRSIKVVNDTIIAPNTKNVTENTKAIVCSIGSVLDYISQRVDDKLNNYQQNNIAQGKQASVCRQANPSKGKVLERYVDDNGDEIIVYDTGLVDMANTKEANRKVDELRQDMKIPMYKPDLMKKPSYFSDEDDITKDIDMNATSGSDIDTVESNDVGAEIQESHVHLDMISKFNNTRNLGYDILQSQGFDYVQPIGFVQESDSKKSKEINIADIQHMKFDNTHITNAVKYFNEARQEQKDAGKNKINVEDLVNSKSYQKAVDCLCKQFDAHINIRYINDGDGSELNIYTSIWYDIKTKLHVSKSKGFQLNGLPIDIFVINRSFEKLANADREDASMFGQIITGVFLHEIFHNIASVFRFMAGEFGVTIASTMAIASTIKEPKKRRKLISNFVGTLDEFCGKKLNIITKKQLIKRLCYMSALQHDTNMMNALKDEIEDSQGKIGDEEIDELIKRYEKLVSKIERKQKKQQKPFNKAMKSIMMVICLILGVTGVGLIVAIPLALITGCMYMDIDKMLEQYRSEKHMEEYYCDLFAGMYKVPVTWLLGKDFGKWKFTPNQISGDKLKKLATLEKKLYEFSLSTYPTDLERNHASVKIAKNLLESGEDLDPAIKKYLEWIVENYSSLLDDTDIEDVYNTATFDPKAADDLDKHLQTLISDNNVTLTESEIMKIINGDTVIND